MIDTPLSSAPYKGLVPYAEEDAAFFFGRDAEREIITANLISSRFTLLYGPSGVGKSSVLRAGVEHHLRERARQNLARRGVPGFAVVVFGAWRDDPIAGLTARIADSVVQVGVSPKPIGATFTDSLRVFADAVDGDLLIILDQFEEYFLYHGPEDGDGTFAVEFPRAVREASLRANFLVSIREDALAKLDRFEGRIPKLFDNFIRIEHLSRDAARDAIVKPIAQYNRVNGSDARCE